MDFIDEEQGFPALGAAGAGHLEGLAQIGDAGKHRRDLLERQTHPVGQQPGDGGLAGAWRPPKNKRGQPARRQHATERAIGPEQMILAHHILQAGRTQAVRQRPPLGLGRRLLLAGEEIAHGSLTPAAGR